MKLRNSSIKKILAFIASLAISITSLAIISPSANATSATTSFELGDTSFNLAGFEGLAYAGVVTDAPAGFTGSRSAKIIESSGGHPWQGLVVSQVCNQEYISAANMNITAQVYSPNTRPVTIKLEDPAFDGLGLWGGNDEGISVSVTPNSSNSWQNLTWDFTGATGYIAGRNYSRMILFFDETDASSGTYYIDTIGYNLTSVTSSGCTSNANITTPSTIITFDSGDTSGYSLSSWDGAKAFVNEVPGGATCPNNGLTLEKPKTAWNVYAGSEILSLSGTNSIISSASKIITANIYSKISGTTITATAMASDRSTFVTKNVTLSAGWQKATFDFASPSYQNYVPSKTYTILQMSINGGSAPNGEVVYVDDIAFNGTATPDIAVAPCPVVVPKSLGMVSSPNINVGDGVVTCKVGTYTTPATDAVFYLYLNGQVISGKTTSAKANWMADWNFVPMSYKSASITSGASWPIQKDWSDGRTSKVQCLVKAYADRGLDVSRTSTATIDKVGRTVRQTAITDLTMRLVEPAMTKTNGVPSNYVDFSYDPIQNNWAKYYGPNLGVYYKYFEAGSTFKVTYKVTNSKTGKPVTNRPVWLIVNKNYGGVQMASFTYSWNEETSAITGHSTDVGEVQIPGWTDSEGLVSFTLTNTNSATEAEPKPAKVYEIQPASVTPLFSTITLTAHLGSDETHETKDIIWGHFTKK